ncbi:MAG: hypothetical protein ACODAD_11840, partial [Planctomycetota bacterium]
MIRRHKPRRGVVLLVVLTLLTLLIVVGVTLVVISGQFRRGAEASARQERYGDDPEKLVDRAAYQLLRDTPNDSRSALKGHSLLRDLVGNDGVAGTVESSDPQMDGEFLRITFKVLPPDEQPFGNTFRTQPGYYNGCTLNLLGPAFVDRPGGNPIPTVAEGARIVDYTPNDGTLTVEWSAGEEGKKAYPREGTPFLINGRPFNGKGAGYDPERHSLDETVSLGSISGDVALLPNYSNYPSSDKDKEQAGGLDESWDAVDYQNMFLAMVPPDTSNGIIPSFHRPALVNYWIQRFGEAAGLSTPAEQVEAFRYPYGPDGTLGTSDDPLPPDLAKELVQFKRMIILRPLPEDHPNFVNAPEFVSTMGLPDQDAGQSLPEMVWDVDNDGDGVPDSIWMDVGLPIQTDDSGRRYKPLVAILCEDLDGRLNVNAHSSPAHISDQYANLGSWPGGTVSLQSSPAPSDDPAPFATSSPPPLQTALLPRGLGVGPADVFLGHLFGRNQFERLLSQRYRHDVTDSGNAAGIVDQDDAMSFIKNLGLPRDYADTYSAFGMPPDIWGRGGIGIDYAGQPLVFYMGEPGETVGDPYELVLSRKAAGYTDAPFTVAELERILRYDDVDAFGLPDRLLKTAVNTFGEDASLSASEIQRNRRRVTTRSRHIPAPGGGVPADRRDDLANLVPEAESNSILDLYRLRLREGGVSEGDINQEMLKIVPWEIWRGQRFNANRLLGNGRDDNGNNV